MFPICGLRETAGLTCFIVHSDRLRQSINSWKSLILPPFRIALCNARKGFATILSDFFYSCCYGISLPGVTLTS
jgi:hypothetical protein